MDYSVHGWDIRQGTGRAHGLAATPRSAGAVMYFRDPDGARLELLADPLGEMYGQHVL